MGRDQADAREFVGRGTNGNQAARGSAQARSGATSRNQSANRRGNQSANQRGGAASGPEIRTELRLGFAYQPPTETSLSLTLTGRIQNCDRIQAHTPLAVSVASGTVILGGTVATPYDRILAEQLVRLEPGVRAVQNDLIVAAATQP